MKSRLTRWWARRPRLGWGAKAARNIILTALLAGAWWLWLGCPGWTCSGALRRLERSLLLTPGQTVYREESGQWRRWNVFVLGDGYAYTADVLCDPRLSMGTVIEDEAVLGRGPVLLRLPTIEHPLRQARLFCPEGPEDAARAELTIEAEYTLTHSYLDENGVPEPAGQEQGTWRYTAQGAREREGCFSFLLSAGGDGTALVLSALWDGGRAWNGDRTEETGCELGQATYRLDFFREDGSLIDAVQAEWGGD